jgi:hypothetical protein
MKMFNQAPSFWRDRLMASAIHATASLLVAVAAALLVFGLWYPYPYRDISGGRELFLLIVCVDVVLGPLVTLAIFNRKKPWKELRRDLAMVVVLQASALGYGLWSVFVARPVQLVFEVDKFRVVHAINIEPEWQKRIPRGLNAFPVLGPELMAVRPFKDDSERAFAEFNAVQGAKLAFQPEYWQPYADAVPAISKAAKPVPALKARFVDRATEISAVLAKVGLNESTAVYLPLIGRDANWTAFLDPVTMVPVAYMQLNSF